MFEARPGSAGRGNGPPAGASAVKAAIRALVGATSAAEIGKRRPPNVRRIEDVKLGDLVWAWDAAAGGPVRASVVRLFRRQQQPVVDVLCSERSGRKQLIRVTPKHPFWVREVGWVPAIHLQPGSRLQALRDGFVPTVLSVCDIGARADVYNFEVQGSHSYYVGSTGVLVHNESQLVFPIDGNPVPYTPLRPYTGKADARSLVTRVSEYQAVHDPAFELGMASAIDSAIAQFSRLKDRGGGMVTPDQVLGVLNEIGSVRRTIQIRKAMAEASADARSGSLGGASSNRIAEAQDYGRALPSMLGVRLGVNDHMIDIIGRSDRHAAYYDRAREWISRHGSEDSRVVIPTPAGAESVPLSAVYPWYTVDLDKFIVAHPNFNQSRMLTRRGAELYSEVLSQPNIGEEQAVRKIGEANFLMMHGTPFMLGSPACVQALNDATVAVTFGKQFPAKVPGAEPFWEAIFAPPGEAGLNRFASMFRQFFE